MQYGILEGITEQTKGTGGKTGEILRRSAVSNSAVLILIAWFGSLYYGYTRP